MRPLTAEWVQKAEEDWRALEWLAQSPDPVWSAVGFHAQQCVEKYLKARLQEAGTAFPKTHDLEALLELLLPVEPTWVACRADLAFLSRFAVENRYPGVAASADEAADARRGCTALRSAIRQSLGVR